SGGRLQPRGKRHVELGTIRQFSSASHAARTRRNRQRARLRLARLGLFDNASETTEMLVLDVARVSIVARLQTQCVTTECKIARQPLRKQRAQLDGFAQGAVRLRPLLAVRKFATRCQLLDVEKAER